MTDDFEKLFGSNMLVETGRGTILSKDGEYFPATTLAELKIPGLPKTRAGIYKIAAREAWPFIHRPGRGAKDGVRYFLVPNRILDKINLIIRPQDRSASNQTTVNQLHQSMDDFVLVPRYDVQGSAGHGSIVQSEQVVDHLAFRADWVKKTLGVTEKDLVLISVKGDSMEPTLSNDDLILVNIQKGRIEDNAVYVLQYDGDLLVKRIQRKIDGTVIVKSDNPLYEQEVLDSSKAESLHVLGRVVWYGRKM